ncbi:MAG: hypothetical protein CL608_00875 [Anaerolineaceae bacterium]|nr:hypothetical protein [Anaerolineaceae bacterium]
MNFIKNIRLKYKPLIVFAALALINAGGIYILRQYVVNEMVDHVLPTQQVVGELGFLTKELQAEALEFISTGEEETVEEFVESSAELSALGERLAGLAQNENELQIFAASEATSLNLAAVGQELIDTHGDTLALIETFEEAELEKDAALDLVDRSALAGESDLTAVLLTQSLSQIERIQTETLDYVLTGEDEVLQILTEERSLFFTNLQALQNVLSTDQTSLAVRVGTILDVSTEIAQLSEQIVANHAETLELLEELEELEGWAAETRTELFNQLDLDTEALLQTANRTAWIVGLVVQVIALGLGFVLARTVVTPVLRLSEAAEKLGQGDYSTRVKVTSSDELGELMANFNEMAETLGQSVASARQQAQAISASSEVSRRLSTILDTSELTTAVVELLQFTFKYYHAHIYLYDDAREYLVMAGGTGEAGRTMLESNHKIESGKGLVGRTAEENKPTLVPDVTADPDWLPNPLLPETKAEIAVPIALENEVLGVLDIQHNVPGGLSQADVTLLASVANQVAIGLQNARLFNQAQQEKEQFQSILESISTPIVISRVATGLVAYVNQALTETFRLSREQLVGQVTPDFYAYPDARARFLTALREHGEAKEFEMVLKRGDGEHFWGLASGRIINYEGEPAIVASIIDIHGRKDAENLLAKQANELSTVAQVSTAAATILDPQELLQQVADLTKSSFDLYHAHIHLLDDSGQTLVLTAGAGEVGREMVAEGRRIPLSATGSLVASVARSVAGAIRNYESPEEGFMPHPLLTATRSEMAVPIAIGKRVMGVLDVRSDQLNYFDESDLQTVTTLASQVAVALQNARSYTRSEEALRELQELSRRLTREGWDEFFGQQLQALAYRYDLEQVSPVAESDEEAESDTETALTQPLQVQGESIGELLLGSAKLNADEAAEIVAAVAERLSAHLENLRLAQQTQSALNETQRRTEELAVLNEMSQALTAQTTVDGVFQTVYNYLSRLMDTTDFYTVLYDEDNDEVEFILTASGDKQRWHTERRQAGTGVTEYLIRQRQPLLMPDNVGQRLADLGIEGYGKMPESWLGVPIILGDRVLGVIGLESYTTPHLYNEQHLNLLTAVANQAAISIESTRLLEGTVALAEEEQILRQITTRVSTAVDAETILRTAAEEIGRALGLEGFVRLESVGRGNGKVK